MKILLVDDRKSLIELVTLFLGQNYLIESKENGKEALDWIEEGNIPDLIITDLLMPVMNGFDLMQKIKTNSSAKNTPIIVLSGKGSSDNRDKAFEYGAADFIAKPFNPAELLLSVQNTINNSQVA